MANIVAVECHLIIGADRFRELGNGELQQVYPATVRVSKGKPSLHPSEVAIALKLQLPIALFRRPQLTATLTVPPESAPFVISPQLEQNIAESIRAQTGFSVRIEAAAPESVRSLS